MPSFRSLSALYNVLFHAISGLAGRLLVLIHRLRIQVANLRLSGISPVNRLPLGFAIAGLVAVIGLTAAGSLTSTAASSNLRNVNDIGPAVAAAGQDPSQAPHQAASPARPAPSKPAPSKPAPAKAAPSKPAPAKASKPAPHKAAHPAKAKLADKEHKAARPAHRKPAHRRPAHHAHKQARPYTIYDSIHPSAIPHHKVVATYATGKYAAQPSEVAGSKSVMWIDITGRDYAASVLDVEPGDATPAVAAEWARHRLARNPHALARIYTMRSEWGAVQSAVSSLKKSMRDRIRWWIADPTGVPHIVPGSSATQWYWGPNYDISTAGPDF